jgi:hypothetical protein
MAKSAIEFDLKNYHMLNIILTLGGLFRVRLSEKYIYKDMKDCFILKKGGAISRVNISPKRITIAKIGTTYDTCQLAKIKRLDF